ncbi:MAG: type B 50S ribosomal protein L31 [Chlamydiales bacterium]|nr:type B 50S ribosomal protein L31 [Chlamydiales bacterium]
MKKQGHPPYQDVLFVDSSTGYKFVCGSTIQTKEKESFEGKEYPVVRLPVSSASHPFFTGSKQFVDSEGRVDKFNKRYSAKKPEKKEVAEPVVEKAAAKKAEAKKPVAEKKKAAPAAAKPAAKKAKTKE